MNFSWFENYRPLNIGSTFAKGDDGLYKEINNSLELVSPGLHPYCTSRIDNTHYVLGGFFPYIVRPSGNVVLNNIGIMEFTPPGGSISRNRDTLCAYQYVNYAFNTDDFFSRYEWNFPGGIPGMSTQQYPIVQYPLTGNYNADVTVTNLVGSVTLLTSNDVNVITCTVGVPSISGINISIFPNPAYDNLTVLNDGVSISSYEIMDLTGRVFVKGDIAGNMSKIIELNSINSGQYIMRLYSEGATANIKFIKL